LRPLITSDQGDEIFESSCDVEHRAARGRLGWLQKSRRLASHPELNRPTAHVLGSGLELGPVSSLTCTLFVFRRLIGTIILGLAL
jgi:hypothetical protein